MQTDVLAPALADLQDRGRRIADKVVERRYWYVRVGLVASAVAYVVQTPLYEGFKNFDLVVRQSRHLTQPLVSTTDTHAAKLTFRLVPPLLLRATHFSIGPYLVFQALLGVLSLSLLAVVFVRVGLSRRQAFALCIAVATTWAGAVFFADTYTYFDSLAIGALVIAMAVRNPVALVLAFSAAAWTDERALPAIVVVAALHWRLGNRRNALAASVVTLVAYAALRTWMAVHFHLATDRADIGWNVLRDFLHYSPVGVSLALEGLWIIVAGGFLVAILRRDWTALIPFGAMGASVVMAMAVADTTRSTIYLLPAVPYCASFLRDEDPATRRTIVLWAVALCVVVPTTFFAGSTFKWVFPLPIQFT